MALLGSLAIPESVKPKLSALTFLIHSEPLRIPNVPGPPTVN
ncbi:hypothetical protein DYBT9275_01932 [Dyadobacter sp. CECT 9275]|uniref:Uncharacterized protein n=1 Tax=Dyadobacter helix TaxID=2822344 RepID=A0A916J9W8_9BACT|nr:hypothetical protein DYBT9275_01932 [Dyadobacter sp. CECT 9275]